MSMRHFLLNQRGDKIKQIQSMTFRYSVIGKMKKSFLLLNIFTVLMLICINGMAQHNSNLDSMDVVELEKTKLKVEIENLESNKKDYANFIQIGTLLAAVLAALVSMWSAYKSQTLQVKTLESQIEQQQKDRTSQLLKELG